MKSSTATLVAALREVSSDIAGEGGFVVPAMLAEAADRMEEMLAAGDRLESQLAAVALGRDRLRLTDAEREAVSRLACACETSSFLRDPAMAKTLRGLLERTKGGGE